jgi:hypothetical protein
VNHFMRQTLPTIKRKHLFMNILCIESFCPQKTLLFGSTLLKHGRHVDCWNQPLNMCMHACLIPRLPWSWTVLLPSDTHKKNYYVHYSWFTSICDLFTDSPSYI